MNEEICKISLKSMSIRQPILIPLQSVYRKDIGECRTPLRSNSLIGTDQDQPNISGFKTIVWLCSHWFPTRPISLSSPSVLALPILPLIPSRSRDDQLYLIRFAMVIAKAYLSRLLNRYMIASTGSKVRSSFRHNPASQPRIDRGLAVRADRVELIFKSGLRFSFT